MEQDSINLRLTLFNNKEEQLNVIDITQPFNELISQIDKKILEAFSMTDSRIIRIFDTQYYYEKKIWDKSKKLYNYWHTFKDDYLVNNFACIDVIIDFTDEGDYESNMSGKMLVKHNDLKHKHTGSMKGKIINRDEHKRLVKMDKMYV